MKIQDDPHFIKGMLLLIENDLKVAKRLEDSKNIKYFENERLKCIKKLSKVNKQCIK